MIIMTVIHTVMQPLHLQDRLYNDNSHDRLPNEVKQHMVQVSKKYTVGDHVRIPSVDLLIFSQLTLQCTRAELGSPLCRHLFNDDQ